MLAMRVTATISVVAVLTSFVPAATAAPDRQGEDDQRRQHECPKGTTKVRQRPPRVGSILFYPNDPLRYQGRVSVCGAEVGLMWYPATMVACKRTDGTLHGEFVVIDSNGDRVVGCCSAGRPHGKWTIYRGKVLREARTYGSGNLDGPWSSWYEDGQLKESGTYRHGHRVGIWTYSDRSGKKVRRDHGRIRGQIHLID